MVIFGAKHIFCYSIKRIGVAIFVCTYRDIVTKYYSSTHIYYKNNPPDSIVVPL